MTFTEHFFRFPAKNYDKEQVEEFLEKLQIPPDDLLYPKSSEIERPEWSAGWFRIPFTDIKSWGEDIIHHKDVKRIAKEGYDGVFLKTFSCGDFEVLWGIKEFEAKLNEAYTIYKKGMEEENKK
jgi:hypothetical protein